MPAANKSTTQPRRSHVTTACTNCRQNKLKCDGQKPTCGTCLTKGHECEYQLGKDRRQFSLRKVSDAYSKRVLQLEQFILSLGAEIPPPPSESDAATLRQVAESMQLPNHLPTNSELAKEDSAQPPFNLESTTQADDSLELFGLQPPYFLDSNVMAADENPMMQSLLNSNSPGSGLSHEAYDFMIPNPELQPHLTTGVEDWMWSLPQTNPFMPMLPGDKLDLTEVTTHQTATAGQVRLDLVRSVPEGSMQQNLQEVGDAASSSEDEHDDGIIEQLSTRLGELLISDAGELKYYGPTSNLTLTEGGLLRESRLSFTNQPKEAIAKLERDGLGQNLEPGLLDELIDLYFTWQDPSCHVVDKPIFYEEREACKDGARESPLYSAALENVICALGALFYTDRYAKLPRPLSKFFADRAKTLVEYELDYPKITTVQTFSLLSWHEATYTKDSRGWLYAGAATRISLDLGLHLDTTVRVTDGSMTARIAHARSVAFWGSFLTDRMWGFYLGRPWSTTQEISLPLPSPQEPQNTQHVWTPRGMFSGGEYEDNPPILDCSRDLLARYWVTLCQTVSSLTTTLYGSRVATKEHLVDLGVETFRRMRQWKRDLPPQLRYDVKDKSPQVTPHVLLLHMQYYVFIIIQHRPFISKISVQPYPPRGDGPHHARRMCLESAIAIARLLEDYASRFAVRLAHTQIVYITFTAALILLYASVLETDRHRHATLTGHLATCCDALAELGKNFENATRSLDTLLIVKRTWQSRLVSGAGRKRRSTVSTDMGARGLQKKLWDVSSGPELI
ncbi:Fungal Zn2-Cys6 binuclear cluster domain-containing protein isoform 3 [Cladophialophora immunda]|nr:Fungal Zn2-Cys6 binuclear cluster domain-containing protein isoform 3 [Cladophialophora immunda]